MENLLFGVGVAGDPKFDVETLDKARVSQSLAGGHSRKLQVTRVAASEKLERDLDNVPRLLECTSSTVEVHYEFADAPTIVKQSA